MGGCGDVADVGDVSASEHREFFIGLLESVVVAWRITLRGKRLVGWLVGADLLIHFNGGSLPV